jgi:hypothetical protein
MEAETAAERMGALCEFIEFWLSPVRPSPGEAADLPADLRVPMPLRRLYECAGRFARPDGCFLGFPRNQDWLNGPDGLTYDESGKLIFLEENQQAWDCRTLPTGEDPPVWCHMERPDRHGVYRMTDELVCDSLSRLLTTYALQELAIATHRMSDEVLSTRFFGERNSAVPVWIDGPYVYGSDDNYSFYLWGHVLVADMLGRNYCLATHDEEGLQFLEENQGPINRIRLGSGGAWTLEISPEGSAQLEYRRICQVCEKAEVPAGTFDFTDLVARLSAVATRDCPEGRSAGVSFGRAGQDLRLEYLADLLMVEAVFRRAIEGARTTVESLERRLETEWPR